MRGGTGPAEEDGWREGDGKLRERERGKFKKKEGEREKVGGTRGAMGGILEQEPGYTDAYYLLWFPVLTL